MGAVPNDRGPSGDEAMTVDLDELFPLADDNMEPCSECERPTNTTNQWGRVVCSDCWDRRDG